MLAFVKVISDNVRIMDEEVRQLGLTGVLSSFTKILFDIRVLYGLGGIFMSVVFHELFHILMHLDEIKQISLFPDSHAIVSITTTLSSGYSLNIEETIAYSITALVLLVTIIDVCAIHDSRDKKSFSKTLFAHQDTRQHLDHEALTEVAVKLKLI